ncbi:MAG TPA: PD-(D/E)XK nuclease family protein [Casimicrobiaceae bacterium]
MHDALARALAAGATVVTPNRRLARHLVDEYDRAQRATGRLAWASARVLPWAAWLGELEREAVAAGALPPLARVSDHASAELWRIAIEEDANPELDPRPLAEAAMLAWDLVNAHGPGDESWRAWFGGGDEPAAFARWASRYQRALADLAAIDAAGAAGRIARAAPSMASWRDRVIVLTGFVAPQDASVRRVMAALRDAGATIDEREALGDARAVPRSAGFASPADELAAALAWARRRVEVDPDIRVGIVVPDLAARLPEVRRAARERLGTPRDDAQAAAWNVSLGPPLADVPLVATALGILSLAWSSLPVGQAATLLRSRYLPDDLGDGRHARARLERAWLERGVRRVGLDDVASDLERRGDPFAERLASLRGFARRRRSATRHEWIDAWRDALRAAGWPAHALASDEHQAAARLDELFAAYATIDAIADGPRSARLGGAEAVRGFVQWAASTPFQPESPAAPIQILGLIESIGLPFDALWIAGMSDDAWPRAAHPHSLLPIRWQRERGVPRSDAAGELAWAREVTSLWLRAAPEVVVSRAPTAEQREAIVSALFPTAVDTTIEVPASAARAAFDSRGPLDPLADGRAPPIAPGENVRATAATIEAQSACPFKALAATRWRVEPWPALSIGLTPAERGTLMHAALEAFFAEVRDSDALAALSADEAALAQACDDASHRAIPRLRPERWREVPDAVREGEAARIARQLEQWIRTVEAARPPFAVRSPEESIALALGSLALSLRIDRVDTLAGGGVAILDYKTGAAPAIGRWTAERPEAMQLALYALAWRESHPGEPVRATAIGQVRPGECEVVGVFADAALRFDPDANRTQEVPGDWAAFESKRDTQVVALAEAFARGEASVAPRRWAECRTCGRQSLCRIGDADDEADEAP